jgi:hypothetical protein
MWTPINGTNRSLYEWVILGLNTTGSRVIDSMKYSVNGTTQGVSTTNETKNFTIPQLSGLYFWSVETCAGTQCKNNTYGVYDTFIGKSHKFNITLWREANNTNLTERPIVGGNTWFRLSANITGECVDNITYYNNASNCYSGIQGINMGCSNITYNHTVVDYGSWAWTAYGCIDGFCNWADNGNWTYYREVTIIPPILNVSNPVVWSWGDTNLTTRNLSVNFTTTLAETNITDWRINNQSIAWQWTFDQENTTGWTKDYSTHGVNMNTTATPPSWNGSSCIKGGCYDFDGVNDYLTLANNSNTPHPETMSEWTMMLWVRISDLPPLQGPFFTLEGHYTLFEETESYLLDINSFQFNPAELRFYNQGTYLVGSDVPSLNVWKHYAITYDGTSLVLYDNSTLKETIAYSQSGKAANSWLIGSGDDNSGFPLPSTGYLNGSVDEFKIFNISLTQTQIKAIYEEELANRSWTTITNGTANCGELWSVGVTATDHTNLITKYSNEVEMICLPPPPAINISTSAVFVPIIHNDDVDVLPIFCVVGGMFLLVFARRKKRKN